MRALLKHTRPHGGNTAERVKRTRPRNHGIELEE
jgi:hypothetical protein